jgi:hypothetical protein
MCDVITKIVIELYRKIVRWPNPKPILQNQISSLVPQTQFISILYTQKCE